MGGARAADADSGCPRHRGATARAQFGIAAEPEWGTEPQRSWDAAVWVGDASRAQDQLDWRAEDDLPTGFTRLAEWLRAHPDLWARYEIDSATVRAR
jgi:hypothetical protein